MHVPRVNNTMEHNIITQEVRSSNLDNVTVVMSETERILSGLVRDVERRERMRERSCVKERRMITGSILYEESIRIAKRLNDWH